MAKGKKVNNGLVNYNTKIEQETKDLTDALVDILKDQGIKSQRELLEEMLKAYEAANPEVFAQARKLVELKAESRNIIYKGGN